MTCPDLAMQLLQFLLPTNLIAYCDKKDNLHFIYVLENGLSIKYLVITLKMSQLKFFKEIFGFFSIFGNCLPKRSIGSSCQVPAIIPAVIQTVGSSFFQLHQVEFHQIRC